MKEDQLLYQVGLTLVEGVGDIVGRKLVKLCGSAEAVFREPRKSFARMPRIGEAVARAVSNREVLTRAEKELDFIRRYRIVPFFFTDSGYPERLRNCYDSPLILYYKGNADLNSDRVVGIVGTRNATEYGKGMTRELVHGLLHQQVLVVSGLAYGIDGCAHRAGLDCGLQTVGVLGHGLDTVYPWSHRHLAERLVGQGGLLTEFMSGTKPDRMNFPKRNRIIAGLCDALIVVEAGGRGGALITADIANSYNRDVFAIPGRVCDPYSEGSNWLIRTNRASLIRNGEDVEYLMGWKRDTAALPEIQRRFYFEMTPEEEKLLSVLQKEGKTGIDDLCLKTGVPMNKTSAALLNLEFEGVVKCLPGKVYVLS